MLNINRIVNNDRSLRAMTGLNRKAFDQLCENFGKQLSNAIPAHLTKAGKPRQRAVGAGRQFQLPGVEDKLFFLLFYFKCYPTFDLVGALFDVHHSRPQRWLVQWQPLLEAALGEKLVLPQRQISSMEAFVQRFPEVQQVMIDGSERPVQRSQNSQQQRRCYSGKKKRHTRKHLVMTDKGKRVLVLSKAENGRVHDKKLLDEVEWVNYIPDQIPIAVDLGFQGLQNEFINIDIPHKKPKGRDLSDTHKQENRQKSRERVVCENALAGVKRYGIVSAVYRNRMPNLDDCFMLMAAGLWNFYLLAA